MDVCPCRYEVHEVHDQHYHESECTHRAARCAEQSWMLITTSSTHLDSFYSFVEAGISEAGALASIFLLIKVKDICKEE